MTNGFKLSHVPAFTHPPTRGYSLQPCTSTWTIIRSRTLAVLPPLCNTYFASVTRAVTGTCGCCFWPNTQFLCHRTHEMESLEEPFAPTHLSKLGRAVLLQTARSSYCENLQAGVSCAPSARTELGSPKCRSKISSSAGEKQLLIRKLNKLNKSLCEIPPCSSPTPEEVSELPFQHVSRWETFAIAYGSIKRGARSHRGIGLKERMSFHQEGQDKRQLTQFSLLVGIYLRSRAAANCQSPADARAYTHCNSAPPSSVGRRVVFHWNPNHHRE